MPIDYQTAKIYKIVDNTTDKIYIGSTCEPTLARRLAKHVGNYKSYLNETYHYVTSFEILKNGDYYIILIENFPCNTKDELFARERYWTNVLICINKNRNQGLLLELGQKEYSKHQNKKYYENNLDKIHMQRHKKNICFCSGKYLNQNKTQHFLTKKHQYYEKQNVILLDV